MTLVQMSRFRCGPSLNLSHSTEKAKGLHQMANPLLGLIYLLAGTTVQNYATLFR